MSSDNEVNVLEFEMYTIDTAKLFISLYPWFFMPSSVHKILIHGADIINAALLPIENKNKIEVSIQKSYIL
jgi:hypothetical protein